jgi:sulfate adenylyltransferase
MVTFYKWRIFTHQTKSRKPFRSLAADDPAHPSVAYLRNRVKDLYLGGKVQAINAPVHFDYTALRCKE